MYSTKEERAKNSTKDKKKYDTSVMDDVYNVNAAANNSTLYQTHDMHQTIFEQDKLKELQKHHQHQVMLYSINQGFKKSVSTLSQGFENVTNDIELMKKENEVHYKKIMENIEVVKETNEIHHMENLQKFEDVEKSAKKNHNQQKKLQKQQHEQQQEQQQLLFQQHHKQHQVMTDKIIDLGNSVGALHSNLLDLGTNMNLQLEEVGQQMKDSMEEARYEISTQLQDFENDISSEITTINDSMSGISSQLEGVENTIEEMVEDSDEDSNEDSDEDSGEEQDLPDNLQSILNDMGSLVQCEQGFDWNPYDDYNDETCDSCDNWFSQGNGFRCSGGAHFICNNCIREHANHSGGGKKKFYVLGNKKLNLGQNGGNIDKFYDVQRFYNIENAKKKFQNQITNLGNITNQQFHFATILNESKDGKISNIMSKKVSIPKKIIYKYITNPENGKEVDITSNLGKEIMYNYTKKMQNL